MYVVYENLKIKILIIFLSYSIWYYMKYPYLVILLIMEQL